MLPSPPKATRSNTEDFPAKPVSLCLALTQPADPGVPAQPMSCPPARPSKELSLNQLFGSPKAPTFCQVAPPLMEDCSTAPSQPASLFHQTFISKSGAP